MVTKIIWNKSALRTFDEITVYLHDNFSLQTAQNFAELTYQKIDSVCKHPTSGRKVRVLKHCLWSTSENTIGFILGRKEKRYLYVISLVQGKTQINSLINPSVFEVKY